MATQDLGSYMSGFFGGGNGSLPSSTNGWWNATGGTIRNFGDPTAPGGYQGSAPITGTTPNPSSSFGSPQLYSTGGYSRVQPVPNYTPQQTQTPGGMQPIYGPGTSPWNPGTTQFQGPTGYYNSNPGTPSFTDPAYQQLNNLVSQRLANLSNPAQFPILDQLQKLLAQTGPEAQQRAQDLAGTLNARAQALQQPLLTDANVANQHALASNNLLASRDAALANSKANLAARGINPNTSGLQLDQANQIAQNYGNQQSNIDARLQEAQIQGDEARRNESTQLSGLATQALQGGDLTAIQNAAQNADLENQLFNINQNQQREALTTAQIPVDLTNQGFSNALNASIGTQNPMSAIMSLLALGNGQQGLQQSADNSNAQGLAGLMQMLLGY